MEPGGTPLAVVTREEPPRGLLVYYAKHAHDVHEATETVAGLAWSLGETVVVEDGDEDFECKLVGGEATVDVVEAKHNSLAFHVSMGKERGYLLVTDAWAHRLDGTRGRGTR